MADVGKNVPRLIKNLKDNTKVSLQLGALTYICSNAIKIETTGLLNEEEYSEICKLVLEAMGTMHESSMRNEATKAVKAVLQHFQSHSLKFFESALQVNRKKRLKIFQLLETVDDEAVYSAARDVMTINFMNDCLHTVQTNTMEWLLPSACTDNLQMVIQAESRLLSDDQELEELTINYAVALLQRLYKIASAQSDFQSIQQFDTLVMDKIVTLAYMGHRRQRAPAIQLLYQAIGTNLALHIKSKYCDVWARYKSDLQGPYCTRMALLVKSCEMDWASLWAISVQLLGTDLHRGATLINNLLSVEERAFKSTDTNVRRQAFVSWKLLIDNFALDGKELATARRIKLLCVPLTAKNSKSELIALTKLEVWWYLITKLYPNIAKFANPVMTQFLNFCFGPLGDTPLLSTKVDIIASPGKRFFKTKIVAIDALLQLITLKSDDRKTLAPILEQRLPHSVTDELFQQCFKTFLHSIGEAVVIIGQLHESEIRNRVEIINVLLANLMRYVKSTKNESKAAVYNEFILVVTELQNRALGMSCVDDFVRDVVMFELSTVEDDFPYRDKILMDLMSKMMTRSILKTVKKKHCEAIKSLLWQILKPKRQCQFHSETLQFLGRTMQQLESVPTDEPELADYFELWFICAEVAYKYALTEDVNEGSSNEPKFKTIEAIIRFPFAYMHSSNSMQAQKIAVNWKDLYKQFEFKADALPNVKPNEILENTSKMIQLCLVKNEKCYRIAVYCLEVILSTTNYKDLLAQNRIPTIVRLVADLTTIALHEGQPEEAVCTLKALSSLLITVYGHCPEKALSYLKDTRKTIELMLKTDADDVLTKEIISTWETIVSILRGLKTFVDANFLESYKEIILLATRHSNTEIKAHADVVIALKDNLEESAKAIFVELEQIVKKSSLKIKSDKPDRAIKQVRLAGSFMNRKIASSWPIPSKPKDRNEKKLAPLSPEPDSQDYVVIKSDVKLDVNRFTEHQKESLKRKRDDIPAMYNDLSQSSSQDTQDLQQWFDGKLKRTEPVCTKPVGDESEVASANDDPNKENKIEKMGTTKEVKMSGEPVTVGNVVISMNPGETCDSESLAPASPGVLSSENPAGDSENVADPTDEPAQSPVNKNEPVQQTRVNLSVIPSSLVDHSYVGLPKIREPDTSSKEETVVIIAKKLDFESRDEYPEEKDKDVDGSSLVSEVVWTSAKANRALRSNKSSAAPETIIAQNVKRPRTYNRVKPGPVGRELRNSNSEFLNRSPGGIQTRGAAKPRGIGTRRSHPNANVTERGVKRKPTSDSDSEESERNKRLRRKTSRSPSGTISDAEGIVPTPTDKRTESEMSRLRIDMVFDGPLPSRRRSKIPDEAGTNSDTLGKRQSPEPKLTRGKSAENRTGDNNLRRRLKGTEKEGPGNTDPTKKRQRKSNRVDADVKAESSSETDAVQPKSSKISMEKASTPSVRKILHKPSNSVSQTIVDDEETQHDAVASNPDAEKLAADANEAAENGIATPSTPEGRSLETEIVCTSEQPAINDDDEIIESSQGDSAITSCTRKAIMSAFNLVNENNADDVEAPLEAPELYIDETLPRASSPIVSLGEPMETEDSEISVSTNDKMPHDDSDETFLDISAIRSQTIEDVGSENADNKTPKEINESNDTPVPSKMEPAFNYSSPKNPAKRFLKPKSFTGHGRAAHMLGLVTKLAVLERDGENERTRVEDEATIIKRYRQKENESDQVAAKKDRPIIVKDTERMGSPGGSRQEKIFNNMKSAEYAASSPGKLFGNLKNNGEKISPRMGKIHGDATSLDSDATASRDEDGDTSHTSERDELPMLEWSSANPPSLTASPSASILKRIRQIVAETDTDSTTNKSLRKRVSFADPPVSKEMGYEVASSGSPLKISKFMSRSPFDRKSSPLRFKQSRFKMIQMDLDIPEKSEEPRMLSTSEIDLDCERENALLVKIAEDLEDTAEYRAVDIGLGGREPLGAEEGGRGAIETIEITNTTVEPEKIVPKDVNAQVKKMSSNVKSGMTGEVETQDDLFDSSGEKNESPKRLANTSVDQTKEELCTSLQNRTIDSIKLNVTDDSVIGSITKLSSDEHDRSETLEDTVDVRNVTSLNSTGSTDEIFSVKPVRTSTRAPDGISQMDTLPVTDSVFASFPITQGSQDSVRASIELAETRFFNATNAVYPALVDCKRPIENVVIDLTNPLWYKNLSNHLTTRGIYTVGDLARLSEREVVRIPIKGSPKVDFLRKVLRRFEEKLLDSPTNTSDAKKIDENADYLALVSDTENSMNIPEAVNLNELPTLDVSPVALPSQGPPRDFLSVGHSDSHIERTIRRTSTTIDSVVAAPSICTILEDTPSMAHISTITLSSNSLPGTMRNVATSTESLPKPLSKSVGSQISLEDLLDDIDAKLVLQSAVKRCSAETLLAQYKLKMGHMPDTELGKETMRMLSLNWKATHCEATLKAACRACGANKVLLRLPDIFSNDKQFFVKVLRAYHKKIKVSDWMESLNFDDVKKEICKKCSSTELTEMLSRVLKEEDENEDVKSEIPELDRLNGILKNMPFDMMISHTVANKDLIPSSVVLDIALQDNEADAVTDAIESQYPEIAQKIVDKKMTTEFVTSYIKDVTMSKGKLLDIYRAVCAKLTSDDLLDAYHEAMKRKLNDNLA